MRQFSAPIICSLVLTGSWIPWGCLGDESVPVHGRLRRRTRYIPKVAYRYDTLKSKGSSLALGDEDFDMFFRGISFSMTSVPTNTVPQKPHTREDRDTLVRNKCDVTAIERSRDILTELLTVSDPSALTNPETSQYKAREWLDNVDPAIICPQSKERIDQRYRLALLYFELGGSSWTRCKAEDDVTTSINEEKCTGKRFLDEANECEWFGMSCGDVYNDVTTEWIDAYYPLEILDLQSNNLNGKLFEEFYDFRNLKEVFLNNNLLSGAITEGIENFEDISVLKLDSNLFEGYIPEAGLLDLQHLAVLSIQGNYIKGSLEKLCDARDARRVEFEAYLSLRVEADCLGESPKVICSCCTCQ